MVNLSKRLLLSTWIRIIIFLFETRILMILNSSPRWSWRYQRKNNEHSSRKEQFLLELRTLCRISSHGNCGTGGLWLPSVGPVYSRPASGINTDIKDPTTLVWPATTLYQLQPRRDMRWYQVYTCHTLVLIPTISIIPTSYQPKISLRTQYRDHTTMKVSKKDPIQGWGSYPVDEGCGFVSC